MSSRRWAANIDMYRKIPLDLMEGTRRGSMLSYFALSAIVILFVLETKAFLSKRVVADLALDRNTDPRVRLNFNITMMDLKCDFCVVDVVSVLGTDQNVTSHITKWQIDAAGVRRRYQGRNKQQRDIILYDESVPETIEELHSDGEDAVSLDLQTLEYAKNEMDYVFVDFYASWCSHCRDLAPTWETLAEVMADAAEESLAKRRDEYSAEDFEEAKKLEMPVMIAKVDCVYHQNLCNTQEDIRAYPTLRLFVDGQPWKGGDYRGHRTVLEMVEWLQSVEDRHKKELGLDENEKKVHLAHEAARTRIEAGEVSDEEKMWHDKISRQKKRIHNEWLDEEHPGCQLSGHLLLDRAPGNFHIQARSAHHDLAAHMTNVSHEVHYLYIGDPMAQRKIQDGNVNPDVLPKIAKKISPMDGNVYVTQGLHEAYHHYLKVISTNIEGFRVGARDLRVYQIVENSQLAFYRNDIVPEAKFIFDLSPISVSYRTSSRHWYDYMTSLMAIIGGIFTVVGMIESGIHAVVTAAHRNRR